MLIQNPKTTGDYLRELRLEHKLEQTDFRTLCGISQPKISNLESGKSHHFDHGTLVCLAKAFKMSKEELMKRLHITEDDIIPLHRFNNDEAQLLHNASQEINEIEDSDARAILFKQYSLEISERIAHKEKLARTFRK